MPDRTAQYKNSDAILPGLCPSKTPTERNKLSPQLFYHNAFIPDQSYIPSPPLQSEQLQAALYPFQQRAVEWMLQREGVRISDHGRLEPHSAHDKGLLSFRPLPDSEGNEVFASHLLAQVLRNPDQCGLRYKQLRGGNLCEEMGLGKTVEIISLMLLHRQLQPIGVSIFDEYTASDVVRSRSTLIITPPAILDQWRRELSVHCPSLKVMHYLGFKNEGLNRDRSAEEVLQMLLEHDVVLVTYNEVAADFHFADEKPQRNLRHEKKYAPMRSPLIRIQWWRCVLDEAQMVSAIRHTIASFYHVLHVDMRQTGRKWSIECG